MTPLSAVLSAILDHLWQSTLVALVIGLGVVTMRKGPASVRHGLWLAASLKFLVPFAALAALGRLLAPPLTAVLHQAAAGPAPAAVLPKAALIEKAAAPLARFPFTPRSPLFEAPLSPAEAGPAAAHAVVHLDPVLILLAVWGLGCAAVLGRWMIRSVRVHRMVRASAPLAWPAPMPVVGTSAPIGPGLVGLWRPVLVTPQSLTAHLSRSEIDAIIAHETCHLRRRDNLTAALHALVEAVFWFHPLVWWIGTRLIAERELACDEAVLRAGHDRKAYARSLLESARLYVQSPLSCVAGASGVDLKSRVEKIMTAPIPARPSPSGKALLLAAAACAMATPVAAGLLTPEGRQAAAPLAKAMAAITAPARALGIDGAAGDEAARPVVLARDEVVLAPSVAVAAPPAPAIALTQNVAEPRLDGGSGPELAPAPRPSQLAVATPPARAARATEGATSAEAAASFVQSYAAATGSRQAIARWVRPICVRIVGLPEKQAAEVKARIETVAKSVGVRALSEGCSTNVQVDFTTEAEETLDRLFKAGGDALSDPTSGTQSVRSMTLPIQAWYRTNGKDVAQNDTGDLKALADYHPDGWARLKVPVQYAYPGVGQPTPSSNMGVGEGPYEGGAGGFAGSYTGGGGWSGPPSTAMDKSRQFLNVFVAVDVKRIPHAALAPVADYVAMLALSQPRSLGQCQALPSITDLFADCPGRSAPEGLTAADLAYLHALYRADHTIWATGRPALAADVAKVMAPRLANAGLASR